MHKTNDVRQKLIDHMMSMELDKMSLADLNLYALILAQLTLAEKPDMPSWAQLGAGLGTIAALPAHEEVK